MNKQSKRGDIFKKQEKQIKENGFSVIDHDFNRPWGGFFVINEKEAKAFAKYYFDDETLTHLDFSAKLSPKVLAVEPDKRLSWQYHHRRAELWKVVDGPVGVIKSDTDEEGPLKEYASGRVIRLAQGERHRLVGLDSWGIIAEIWQHTDPENPSAEEDIVRLQDDFGR